MLAVLAGVTFALPLLAGLAGALGASREAAVVGSLVVALVGAVAIIGARRRRTSRQEAEAAAGKNPTSEEERDARL